MDPTLPSLANTGTNALPQEEKPPLLNFADIVRQSISLAKQKRNKVALQTVGANFKPGMMNATSFGNILSNLNQASTDFSTDLTAKLEEANQGPKYEQQMVGNTLYEFELDPRSGQLLSKRALITVPKALGADEKPKTSGGLQYTNGIIGSMAAALNASKSMGAQADGKYVDPALYKQFYDNWTSQQGLPQDFVKLFPPEQWVNPANNLLPESLLPKKKNTGEEEDDWDTF